MCTSIVIGRCRSGHVSGSSNRVIEFSVSCLWYRVSRCRYESSLRLAPSIYGIVGSDSRWLC